MVTDGISSSISPWQWICYTFSVYGDTENTWKSYINTLGLYIRAFPLLLSICVNDCQLIVSGSGLWKKRQEMISWGTRLILKSSKHIEKEIDTVVHHASNDKSNESYFHYMNKRRVVSL